MPVEHVFRSEVIASSMLLGHWWKEQYSSSASVATGLLVLLT
jgi:hypothetical protein